MTFQTIMTVIAMHWVADFVLQSDWQAKNKSKDNFLSDMAARNMASVAKSGKYR